MNNDNPNLRFNNRQERMSIILELSEFLTLKDLSISEVGNKPFEFITKEEMEV